MGRASCLIGAAIGHFAVAEAGAGKGRARHFEFADDDAENGAEDGFFANGGVNLARGLEQRLQACYLLLQIDGLVVAGQMNACCHSFYLKTCGESHFITANGGAVDGFLLDGFYPMQQRFRNLYLMSSCYVANAR